MGGPPVTQRKRSRGPSGDSIGGAPSGGPIRFEVRWVYDGQDLKQLGVSSPGGNPLGDNEFAESDQVYVGTAADAAAVAAALVAAAGRLPLSPFSCWVSTCKY